MKSRLNLKPGKKGTKRLVEKYGDALLYIRHRYDPERGVRLKTVELVVEEKPWRPRTRFREEDIVKVTVAYSEQALRVKLKAAGGIWAWRTGFGRSATGPFGGRSLKAGSLTKSDDLCAKVSSFLMRLHPK